MPIKVQSFVFLIIIALGFYFEINSKEWIIHIILIGFILTTEALNTVAEKICDLINPKYDERIKLIKDISSSTTILLIEHNMDVVMSIADNISVLHFGEIIAEGDKKTIQNDPIVQKAYLGD